MTKTLAPQKTDLGWLIEIPQEMAAAMGVAEGSFVVLHPKEGSVEVEILPPASPELKESVRQICEEFRETFEELKRLGD